MTNGMANDMTGPSFPQASSAFDRFARPVREWFLAAFEAPTPVQRRAWDAIASGENTLVIAPTGSGKTLAAFLFAIDALMREKAPSDSEGDANRPGGSAAAPARRRAERPAKGVSVLYVSPLKALGADVERNLREPLAAIAGRMALDGDDAPSVRVGVRTGDTPPDQRRSLQRRPPDILITTPESLYLMLTSKAREGLRTVRTVVVDEVHALVGDKRGAHLSLSLERLDDLLARPAQRIGLSATVRPRQEAARFLGGVRPVRIVADDGRPRLDVRVTVPVRDMTDVASLREPDADGGGGVRAEAVGVGRQNEAWRSDRALRAAMGRSPMGPVSGGQETVTPSIWPYIEESILDAVLSHRTTIVFVNSRGLCEKLTARLNERYARRLADGAPASGVAASAAGSTVDGRDPAPTPVRSDLGTEAKRSQGASAVIAKAHHGSVSKEKRLQVEHELKTGQVSCVVATSSLELGIDMGSIDLVIQVAAPPSVASGLQRVGRANHQVGGRSEGVIYPRTRTEVIDAAVMAERMEAGAIEETSFIRNPLDVLAQQTVAAVALDEVAADAWYGTVRRAAPFSDLPRKAFDAVLAMLAGLHASTGFDDFSPRIVWDRTRGMLVPRPGTQRRAVMAAGTIPDRGMFSVVLPEGAGAEGRRRVGELDEEMVYESRVGDVIALGTSSWRIREITRDRVIVEPAAGRGARLPFWRGEGVGRPAETGRARGGFLRAVALGVPDDRDGRLADVDDAVRARLVRDGLDGDARGNLVALIRAQRAATGVVPDDRTLLVERCEDETGDWRVMLHSPYGRRVHEPWAMAVTDRVMRTQGFDPQAMASDDGIVLLVPAAETRLPGAELFAFDPDELDGIVRGLVGSTSLFAARFRECAARALLMAPVAPGKRTPLWKQRLKAGQLLEAARRERDFPLLLETARECLQDVYDLPALRALMERLQAGAVRLVERQTSVPSPFAAPLLFGYVGEHLYQGDLPHAEQRASLLSLDPGLLGELLGTPDVAELLDPAVVRFVEDGLQRLAPARRVRGVEGVADLLRALGPLSVEEVARRLRPAGSHDFSTGGDAVVSGGGGTSGGDGVVPGDAGDRVGDVGRARGALEELRRARRVFPSLIGGEERWASVDDAVRLERALGVAVPSWVPSGPFEEGLTGRISLDGIVARHARTLGPFSAESVARRLGVSLSTVHESLERLVDDGMVMRGRFGVDPETAEERSWVSTEVFERIRSLSLAKARKAVRPVDGSAFVRFLLDRQGVGSFDAGRFEGVDGVAQVLAQFEGVFLPAALWEERMLPSRVCGYRPSMLDELLASGEVLWVGARRAGDGARSDGRDGEARRSRSTPEGAERRGLVAFYPTDSPLAPTRPDPAEGVVAESMDVSEASEEGNSAVRRAVVEVLSRGGGLFFSQVVAATRQRLAPDDVAPADVAAVLDGLAWSGRATNDTFAPVRFLATAGRRQEAPRRRISSRRARPRLAGDVTLARGSVSAHAHVDDKEGAVGSGRWSLLMPPAEEDAAWAIATVDSILDRYGVLSRDVATLSGVPGGMSALYPVLRSMEDVGAVVRGRFVEGLGPAQFAARETVDLLRTYASEEGEEDEEGEDDRRESADVVVLATDDPACLFGAGVPWPPVADVPGAVETVSSDVPRSVHPMRRAGNVVVVAAGRPVLYATAGLRSMLSFTDDEGELVVAVSALVTQETRAARRAGAQDARRKILVETFNGVPVLSTPFAETLRAAGFVRLPDGMRLYVLPF